VVPGFAAPKVATSTFVALVLTLEMMHQHLFASTILYALKEYLYLKLKSLHDNMVAGSQEC
jgi:hypothetical protein